MLQQKGGRQMSDEKKDIQDELETTEEPIEKTDDELREEERQSELDGANYDDGNLDEPKGEDKPEPKEPERFKLDEPKTEAKAETDGAEELFDIVHNGQEYRLTKEKVRALAQKGFDYDYKIGPHGKLVQMIEADPEIAEMVNNHWQKKISGVADSEMEFQVKPLDEYANESEWLVDNIKGAIETFSKKSSLAPPTQHYQGSRVSEALQLRDPEYFHKVLPKLAKYAGDLSVSDYSKIDSDMGALCKFYDYVKAREFSDVPAAPQQRQQPKFSIRSGGGEAPTSASQQNSAWRIPKADFLKQLDKVKGYG
jgi:hypothetical protein